MLTISELNHLLSATDMYVQKKFWLDLYKTLFSEPSSLVIRLLSRKDSRRVHLNVSGNSIPLFFMNCVRYGLCGMRICEDCSFHKYSDSQGILVVREKDIVWEFVYMDELVIRFRGNLILIRNEVEGKLNLLEFSVHSFEECSLTSQPVEELERKHDIDEFGFHRSLAIFVEMLGTWSVVSNLIQRIPHTNHPKDGGSQSGRDTRFYKPLLGEPLSQNLSLVINSDMQREKHKGEAAIRKAYGKEHNPKDEKLGMDIERLANESDFGSDETIDEQLNCLGMKINQWQEDPPE